MTLNNSWRIRVAQILFGAAIVIALVGVRGAKAGNKPVHMAKDWSHRHLVFSAPRNNAEKARLMSNPRYVQQLVRQQAAQHTDLNLSRWKRAAQTPHSLHGDWNQYMGYNGDPTDILPGTAGPGTFPAKYSFDATIAACSDAPQPDFVVYNTSLVGSSSPVQGFDTLTVTTMPTAGDTITIYNANTTLTLTLTAAAGPNSNLGSGTGTFNIDASPTAQAADIAAAINISGNGSYVGVSAISAGSLVTSIFDTPGYTGDGIYAGTSGSGTMAWTFPTFQDDGTGIPTVVAFNNLYTGCLGTVPSSVWSFNTGGQSVTSPIVSGDGSQVALVQNVGSQASLVIFKWADFVGANFPITLFSQASGAAYRSCSAPCDYTIAFAGTAATDTHSSPFYDYHNDVLYVGDDDGYLHQFTGVFLGTPAEVVSTGTNVWPASVNPGAALTSPVYDDGAGGYAAGASGVFVGDFGGFFHRVDITIGSGTNGIVTTAQLASSGSGIDDGPLVDSTMYTVYVSVRGDMNVPQQAGVFQFPSDFASGATGTESVVSTGSILPATAFYSPQFDNNYFNSVNATGNLYVCGTNGGVNALWQIPLVADVMGPAAAGPSISSANVACSPTTEFFNSTITNGLDTSGTDFLYVSVPASPVNCPTATTGCVMSFDITNSALWLTSTTPSATAAASAGTSGIIVDNAVPPGTYEDFGENTPTIDGASQIYFSPLGNGNCTSNWQGIGGCAIQMSQSGLD